MSNVKKTVTLSAVVLVVMIAGSVSLSMKLLPKNETNAEQFYVVNQLRFEYSYVLIVSEESHFKNNLVKRISDHFYSRPILFSVINEEELISTNEDIWDMIIIVTTAHDDDVVQAINHFINNHKSPEKVCLVVTTENGKWNSNFRDGVDVITTTSQLKNTAKISGRIIKKIDPVAMR